MFSLQSFNAQNQLLYSLTQLSIRHTSSLFKTKHNLKADKDEETTSTVAGGGAEILDLVQPLCEASLHEALRNCDRLTLAEFAKLGITNIGRLHHSTKQDITASGHSNPWLSSYVSGNTFAQNKNISPVEKILDNVLSDPYLYVDTSQGYRNTKIKYNQGFESQMVSLLCSPKLNYSTQIRGFKTDRTIECELKRNPTMSQRFKTLLGSSQPLSKSLPVEIPDKHIIERLLIEEGQNLKPEEKDKIKIAFAEGYMTGSNVNNKKVTKTSKYLRIVQQLLTIIIFFTILITLMSSSSGSVFRIQIGSHQEIDPEEISVTFDDVKGADEAKQELLDVVEFLKSPERFSQLGGKLPKGVLLVGPPGTGKTLLARAIAGEAGVPFFHAAGPEFDEVLVGQGARRVRDLFKAAKERAPCVIFIDEIDSVGAKRSNSVLHPYANQTINQLLSEMDGFHQNEGVIVLGATNRRDDLDPAILRPGRFDVEVNVPTPDYTGRREILGLYLGRVLTNVDVDAELLARGTTGFTGADLESMVNQAALKAAIDGAKTVSMKHLEGARDKVLMGPERRSRLPDEEANLITAYHEGGHAIVAYYTKESHPLHKVTIIPRGPSLGHTAYIPAKERYHVTKQQLQAMIDTMMGGRAAEELIFGPDKITSGASSDLKQATSIASHMVREWGMSEKVGLRTLDTPRSTLAGGEILGPSTNELVDTEIKRILSESYERARTILKTHAKEHKALAEALLKYETLDAEHIKAIMAGEKLNIEHRDNKESIPAAPA